MQSKKRGLILLSLMIGLAAVFIWSGLLRVSPARALGHAEAPQQAPQQTEFYGYFTETLPVQILDLSGNAVAEGTHLGQVSCNRSKCSHKIDVELSYSVVLSVPYNIEYRFTDRQSIDPENWRAVIEGTGTAGDNGQKQKFRFSATFLNNPNGTVTARYEASIPEFSFVITSPGSMQFSSR